MDVIKNKFGEMLNNNSFMKPAIKTFELLSSAKTNFSKEFENIYVGIGYIFTPRII